MNTMEELTTIDKQFYPTPKKLAQSLFEMAVKEKENKYLGKHIVYPRLDRILEPSAGKGDLIDEFIKFAQEKFGYNDRYNEIDVIELDFNLQGILKHKGYRVVYDDFLSYQSPIKYDFIVMNPPFKNGDSHLLKALDLMKDGGEILCILNAETIKNPYSNTRKLLLEKLEEYKAEIKYLDGGFADAERKTDVEVALIHVDIEKNIENFKSNIFDDMKKANEEEFKEKQGGNFLTQNNLIDSLIEQYNLEIKLGKKLIDEYLKLKSIKLLDDSSVIGSLTLALDFYGKETITERDYNIDFNKYVKNTRLKYRRYLFRSDKLGNMLTSDRRQELYNQLQDFKNFEFDAYNIFQLQQNMTSNLTESIDDSIMDLFDMLSKKYAYSDSIENGNVHYYTGWKTNKAYKINKKCIIPYSSIGIFADRFDITNNQEKVIDIIIALGYLDGKVINRNEIVIMLAEAQSRGQSKDVELPYLRMDFYKKGTAHIKFTDLELLKKLNRYAAKNRNWLPPNYGKKNYKDMNEEEKNIVDGFEGKETYQKDLEDGKLILDNVKMIGARL